MRSSRVRAVRQSHGALPAVTLLLVLGSTWVALAGARPGHKRLEDSWQARQVQQSAPPEDKARGLEALYAADELTWVTHVVASRGRDAGSGGTTAKGLGAGGSSQAMYGSSELGVRSCQVQVRG